MQQTLFNDRHVCVFDASVRFAPETMDDYCAAPHAAMLPGRFGRTDIDRQLAQSGQRRKVVLSAPSFAMLAAVIHGTDIVATMPSRLAENFFKMFEICEPPVETPTFSIAQVWHRRNNVSPRHVWFRRCIRSITPAPAD